MNPTLGRVAGIEVADALGIDIDGVRKITLVFDANDTAYVVIEKFIDKEDVTGLADTFKKYRESVKGWTELRNELDRV